MGYDDVSWMVLCSLFLGLALVFAKFRFGCRLENDNLGVTSPLYGQAEEFLVLGQWSVIAV